jgi:hypothetical protein
MNRVPLCLCFLGVCVVSVSVLQKLHCCLCYFKIKIRFQGLSWLTICKTAGFFVLKCENNYEFHRRISRLKICRTLDLNLLL